MTDNLTGTQETTATYGTDWRPSGNGGQSQGEAAAGAIGKTATGLTEAASEYTDKISEVVTQAKEFVGDKVNIVGGKIKDFAVDDLSGLALKAKDFARQNPGQAILVSAAAGMLLGLIVRGRR